VLVLVPVFVPLDFLIAADSHLAAILGIRLIVMLVSGTLLALVRSDWFARSPVAITAFYFVFLGWAIDAIVLLSQGYGSAYYPGVMLVMLGSSLLYLWPPAVCAAVHGVTALGLLIPHQILGWGEPLEPGLLAGVFVGSTAIIATTGQFSRYRATQRQAEATDEVQRLRLQAEELAASLQERTLELEKLASTDALTGLANRRTFEEVLAQRWRWLGREQEPLALLMCDIDHFKAYNDTLGHTAGDHCLQQVAEALTRAVQRPMDLVCRYGGEEFAVILCEADTLGATAVARRIRRALHEIGIGHPSSPTSKRVTLSIGVAASVPTKNRDPHDLLETADSAMYEAKQKGRDRVVGGRADSSNV